MNHSEPNEATRIGEQSGQTVEGIAPDGSCYKAMFVVVRRRAQLYVHITITPPKGDVFRYERTMDLKREMHTRAMRGERHNLYVLQNTLDNFVNSGVHAGLPEVFLRAAWQRTTKDRYDAVLHCFEDKNKVREEKGEQGDLFA